MQLHTEKKYKVESFDEIVKKLSELDVIKLPTSESHHYYAKQDSLDVIKLVISLDKCEIHILEEKDGTFTLLDRIPVEGKDAGITWLKDHGFNDITHIKMVHSNYIYAGGIVGLYVINDKLNSVILDYPIRKQSEMARLFGLETAKLIEQPYNLYSQQ